MGGVPHELAFGGVYVSPLLVAWVLGIAATVASASYLNRRRWSRLLANPTLVLVSLNLVFTVLIGTFLIKI